MPRWTIEQVEQQAPDTKVVRAARKLASPGPWSEAGSTETLVWGKCQGSGATPYQVSIDLTGPSFKCSCPSRKFPCKHGLALLLLWVDGKGSVADTDAPADFAADWVAARASRAKRSATAGKAAGPADLEAKARRAAQRVERMSAGLEEFERWLEDLVTSGLATAKAQPYSWWDQVAARLVDAQLPGLAERVRAMGSSVQGAGDWATDLLLEAGRWHLAVQAWGRRDELSENEAADLRTYLGWARQSDEIGDRVEGRWQVVGVHRTDDGRLQARRTWLTDLDTGLTVLVLDFAAVGGALRVAHLVGTVIAGELARYPGSAPSRVLLPDTGGGVELSEQRCGLPGLGSISDALASRAAQVAANPWLERSPCVLTDVVVVPPGMAQPGEPAKLMDAAGDWLPVTPDTDPWPLLAHAGPCPVSMFAELDDGGIRPLTVGVPDGLVSL